MVVADDGDSYRWEGEIVGAGQMEVISETPQQKIDYRLTFLKPWKSVAAVSFDFQDKGGATEATWTMNSSLPFFMFWMKNMMTAMIGVDYQRGLSMLKDYIETGSVPSKLEFPGKGRFQGASYLGIRTTRAIADIGERMDQDFKSLFAALESSGTSPSGKPITIYHKYDFVKGITEYTSGIPVETQSVEPSGGMFLSEIESCNTYQVKHTGPYRHLGNAWSAGMAHERSKVFKLNKKIPPFEVYENDYREVAENELETTIHFPVA